MTDPTTLKLVDNIGTARGTDYLLMKEQLTKEEVAILETTSYVMSTTPRVDGSGVGS